MRNTSSKDIKEHHLANHDIIHNLKRVQQVRIRKRPQSKEGFENGREAIQDHHLSKKDYYFKASLASHMPRSKERTEREMWSCGHDAVLCSISLIVPSFSTSS
jgi:hypothetical protein